MKKVLVIGAAGMLAQALIKELIKCADISVVASYNEKLPSLSVDIPLINLNCLNLNSTNIKILANGFDYIINCAVRKHGSKIVDLFGVNTFFPLVLSSFLRDTDCKLINISTDAVYSGRISPTRFYTELDHPDPIDNYGLSKLLGESTAKNVLNIRTSIVGLDPLYRSGILEMVLNAKRNSTFNGYGNYIWSGVTTHQFAIWLCEIILSNMVDKILSQSSVVNYTCNDPISKFDLLIKIANLASREDIIIFNTNSPTGAVNRHYRTVYNEVNVFPVIPVSLESSLKSLIEESYL